MKEVNPMDIFDWMKRNGHEQVIFNLDKETGLQSVSSNASR
jgi:hypothetical protein